MPGQIGRLRFLTIRVDIPSALVDEIKRLAKRAFPNETLSYLLGVDAGTNVEVRELWTPDDVADSATDSQVTILDHWRPQAIEYARENDLDVLGTFHSHPYPIINGRNRLAMLNDPAPSSGDHLNTFDLGPLIGICVVSEAPSGVLRSKFKLWGPQIPVDVRLRRRVTPS